MEVFGRIVEVQIKPVGSNEWLTVVCFDFDEIYSPRPPLTPQQKLSAEIILNSSITDSLDI